MLQYIACLNSSCWSCLWGICPHRRLFSQVKPSLLQSPVCGCRLSRSSALGDSSERDHGANVGADSPGPSGAVWRDVLRPSIVLARLVVGREFLSPDSRAPVLRIHPVCGGRLRRRANT